MMITEVPPEHLDSSHKQALKLVLKWEIQTLLQRLADVGEETVVLTADLQEGQTGQLGSSRGCNFLLSTELQDVKSKFLSFCAGCQEDSDTEPYRDQSTGDVTSLPKNTPDNSGSKRRSNTSESRRKKRPRRSHTDIKENDQPSGGYHQDTKSDTAVAGNETDDGQINHKRLATRSPRKSKTGSSSRRKRTPKKIKAMQKSYFNMEEENTFPAEYCSDNDLTEYHSDKTDLTGYHKNTMDTHFNNIESDYQSSGAENSVDQAVRRNKMAKTENQSGSECGDTDGLNVELQNTDSKDPDDLLQLIQSGSCRTLLLEDGGMRIIQDGQGGQLKTEVEELSGEDLDGLALCVPRPGSRHFKSASSDEMPSETLLLDSSKLGVRRYQCPLCFLIVRDRHDLKRHLRTHTKIKPYHCEFCGRNFTRKWDMENHLRRHQEETLREISSKAPVTMVDLDDMRLHSKIRVSRAKTKRDKSGAETVLHARQGPDSVESDPEGSSDNQHQYSQNGDKVAGMDQVRIKQEIMDDSS